VARNQGAGKMLRVDLLRMLNAMLKAYLMQGAGGRGAVWVVLSAVGRHSHCTGRCLAGR
jgi:hypothetical protein